MTAVAAQKKELQFNAIDAIVPTRAYDIPKLEAFRHPCQTSLLEEIPDLTCEEYILLNHLGYWAGAYHLHHRKFLCDPKNSQILEKTPLCRSQLERGLKSLEDRGIITRHCFNYHENLQVKTKRWIEFVPLHVWIETQKAEAAQKAKIEAALAELEDNESPVLELCEKIENESESDQSKVIPFPKLGKNPLEPSESGVTPGISRNIYNTKDMSSEGYASRFSFSGKTFGEGEVALVQDQAFRAEAPRELKALAQSEKRLPDARTKAIQKQFIINCLNRFPRDYWDYRMAIWILGHLGFDTRSQHDPNTGTLKHGAAHVIWKARHEIARRPQKFWGVLEAYAAKGIEKAVWSGAYLMGMLQNEYDFDPPELNYTWKPHFREIESARMAMGGPDEKMYRHRNIIDFEGKVAKMRAQSKVANDDALRTEFNANMEEHEIETHVRMAVLQQELQQEIIVEKMKKFEEMKELAIEQDKALLDEKVHDPQFGKYIELFRGRGKKSGDSDDSADSDGTKKNKE